MRVLSNIIFNCRRGPTKNVVESNAIMFPKEYKTAKAATWPLNNKKVEKKDITKPVILIICYVKTTNSDGVEQLANNETYRLKSKSQIPKNVVSLSILDRTWSLFGRVWGVNWFLLHPRF